MATEEKMFLINMFNMTENGFRIVLHSLKITLKLTVDDIFFMLNPGVIRATETFEFSRRHDNNYLKNLFSVQSFICKTHRQGKQHIFRTLPGMNKIYLTIKKRICATM